jgi:hypothetical protein
MSIALKKNVDGSWEMAREGIREDLEIIEVVFNNLQQVAFAGGTTLTAFAISGNRKPATRYVANTGPNNTPKWDLVNLVNGVTGRLALSHFALASENTVLGRRRGTNGDYEPLTPGIDIFITSTAGFDVSNRVKAATSLELFAACGGL